MKTVETVRGPVPADELGFVLPHEHIIVDTYDVRRNSEGVLLDHQMAIDEVAFFKEAGGDTIVEQTIYGLHPDPLGLRDISEKTGVHIITGTGFYWEMYYPSWLAQMSTTDIAKRFVEQSVPRQEGPAHAHGATRRAVHRSTATLGVPQPP